MNSWVKNNEQFLKELKKRDFYEDYKSISQELEDFKKVQLSLINDRSNLDVAQRGHSNSQNIFLRERFEMFHPNNQRNMKKYKKYVLDNFCWKDLQNLFTYFIFS